LDQSDCITRRPADRQYPLREDARSDLRAVTAVALAVADQVYRQGSAALDLLGLTTEQTRALANALRTTRSTFILIL
jgi:hypothetical protein